MKVLVVGSVGLQVSIPIDSFPLEYQSIYFMDDKVEMDIAGVGYSSYKILSLFNDDVTFLTGLGNDFYGKYILDTLKELKGNIIYEIKDKQSLISTILYDHTGKRSILREGRKDYMYHMNSALFNQLEDDYDVCVITMSNFARDVLPVMKDKNIPIVCDMQTVGNLTNDYGKDFMVYSDVIFFSNDHYEGDIEQLVLNLYKKYNYHIIGVGLGKNGVLLCVDGEITYYPARDVKVVNTVGAGDSLFSSFISLYYNGESIDEAINKAIYYVSEKIQHKTASKGLMTLDELNNRYTKK